jgi:CheY-like chemotaxis protein
MLVCAQEESSSLLLAVLEEMGTRVESHADAMEALQQLWTRRFDAVIVDCEGRGQEAEVVREVHEAAQNRSAVTIAIIGPKEKYADAYALGAHFVMRKPLTPVRVRRLLRASYPLMVEELRRHLRHPCQGPVQVVSGVVEVPAALTNLSQGGVAVILEPQGKLEPSVRLRFRLPGTKLCVVPEGKVVWQTPCGHAGIRFTAVTALDRLRLNHWLEDDLEKDEAPGKG